MKAPRSSLIVAVILGVVAAGCASSPATSPSDDPPRTVPADTTAAAKDGWLGDAPDWSSPGDAESAGGGTETVAAAAGKMTASDAATGATGASGASGAPELTTAAPAPVPPGDATEVSPLRAGSVDDNADFDAYRLYRERIAALGIALRGGDPAGRVVVTVTGSDGHPVRGAVVEVADATGQVVASLTTTADGTARFLPAMWAQPVDGAWTFDAGEGPVAGTAGGTAALTLGRPGAAPAPVAIDVLFLLDATGSMADEIDRLKTSIDSVVSRIGALEGAPDVRLGMTVYRDEGDAFVTSTFDFTADVGRFHTALADVVADGGGDYPEALDEAFADALTAPAWRDPAEALQLVFLVADAPPHVERQVPAGYDVTLRDAVARGVKVFPVASSESDDQAEAVFRQIAQATGARFVFLSYGAAGAATGASTDIESTDYEELALDDLVVRLIAEEVADLTGDADVVPPQTPTSTTNPPGQ